MKSMPGFFKRQKKALVICSTWMLMISIGIVDAFTGPELSLSPFYLIPVFISAYFVGLWSGVAISVASIFVYLVGDRILSISYSRSTIPFWNAAVRLSLFLAVAYVLAKRRIAEEKLARSEERFRLLVDGVKDYAIVMLDREGRIISWNKGAEKIYGFTNEEILDRHFSCFYFKGDMESRKPDIDLKVARDFEKYAEEGWRLRKGDEQFWADVIITPLKEKGDILRGYSMLTRDNTERKKAEEAIRIFAALHEIDRMILSAGSSEKIAEEALGRMRSLIPFQVGTVTLFDFQHGQGQILALEGNDRSIAENHFFLDASGDDTGLLVQGQVQYIKDKLDAHDYLPLTATLPFGRLRSYVNLPLLSQGSLIGSINLGMSKPSGFTAEHLQIAREIANQVALAIQSARLFDQLRLAHQRLKTLSGRLLEVQEAEKHKLARELHDEMGQALTALRIHLEELEGSDEACQTSLHWQESISIVEKLLNQVRNLSLDLRPLILDDLGLVAALRWHVSRTSNLAGFGVHFEATLDPDALSSDLETVCFRVAQEAITNIVRHASATHVNVELTSKNDEVCLLIKDDGKGFDVEHAQSCALKGESLGLLGMKERVMLAGGCVEIESVPSFGTEVRVRLPLKPKEMVLPI